ncbi:hypothetical protein IDH44_01610 [Paenibacillus sp. IB182496]|uniref:SGNH hydrolase-type esterase domain-containing protein n=1 Tax=Paenibacillus sabuli TaxID=2772509 RepID=A0A927BQG1_9BACL|nr:GDSL-type esterase/lipase family protein [Paenibacillus sabuli]MBD2843875.1 hypothetical protein [Paenibacillus sabuli]
MKQQGEPFVFVGTEPQPLRHRPAQGEPVVLHSPAGVEETYEEGQDYLVDYGAATITRTADSRIPDWRVHPHYGVKRFDHMQYADGSNTRYTCYADYVRAPGREAEVLNEAATARGSRADAESRLSAASLSAGEPVGASGDEASPIGADVPSAGLPAEMDEPADASRPGSGTQAGGTQAGAANAVIMRLQARLEAGGRLTYLVLGDSISTGAEASEPALGYPERTAAALRAAHPGTAIRVVNGAVGGENTRGALARIDEALVREVAPELVTIGYGMNDQNARLDGVGNSVPSAEFAANLEELIARVRRASEAEIVLLTPCVPNPQWQHASANVEDYAEAIRAVGRRAGVPVADVQPAWLEELAAGKSHQSLLRNNINHPGDYGHALYAAVLGSLLLWAR